MSRGHDRPWWRKKRFLVPGAFVALVSIGSILPYPSTPETVDGQATTRSSSTTTVADQPPETTSEAPSTTQDETLDSIDARLSESILERDISVQELDAATSSLGDATVLDDLGAPVPYRRTEYSDGWGDADGDCESDRHEILIDRSEVPVVVVDCKATTGQWTDPYDGTVYSDARLVTIDHFVPLAAAHRAGAWAWEIETKRAFAADIAFRASHVPAGQATNEQKGDKEPHLWRPQREAWCGYAIDWIAVKTRWQLNYSIDEAAALTEMLAECEPVGTETSTTTTPPVNPVTSTTTSSTTTTIVVTPGDAIVEITRCDARGESVELVNSGGESITLRGWTLHDEGRKHETDLSRVILDPGQRIVMLSGEDTLDVPGTFRWTGRNVWNNDGDQATLLQRNGAVVSTLRC